MPCHECGAELTRRTQVSCDRCGVNLCAKHQYIRVDGNNASITKHARKVCRPCYQFLYEKGQGQ